jgi:mercuric ion transport protein
MKKQKMLDLAALSAAFFSSICCLPPLLFMVFGISVGWMSFVTSIGFLRLPLAVGALLLFALSVYNYNKNTQCSYNKNKIVKYSIIFIVIMLFLLYPEISIYFIGDE